MKGSPTHCEDGFASCTTRNSSCTLRGIANSCNQGNATRGKSGRASCTTRNQQYPVDAPKVKVKCPRLTLYKEPRVWEPKSYHENTECIVECTRVKGYQLSSYRTATRIKRHWCPKLRQTTQYTRRRLSRPISQAQRQQEIWRPACRYRRTASL